MSIIAIKGIRGGVGVTSVSAGLGFALRELGESVLIIDFCPSNLLHVHFNGQLTSLKGWARAMIDGNAWHENAFQYSENLTYLPFGNLTTQELGVLMTQLESKQTFWNEALIQLSGAGYDWILLDLPHHESQLAQCLNVNHDFEICIVNPDPACHILLHNKTHENAFFLLNQHSPKSQLQQDIKSLWHHSLKKFLPIIIHKDDAIPEALAQKQPLAEYSAASLAAEEMTTLAAWCLIHCKID